jgi:CTP synthase
MQTANSTEFDKNTKYKVIFKLRDLIGVEQMGGTMRLGAYECLLSEGSIARKAYGTEKIRERHRHRYEFNPEFREALENSGLKFTGISPDGKFVEIVELTGHPWYLACQFHPEFKSRPLSPHPLFSSFIKAASHYALERVKKGND